MRIIDKVKKYAKEGRLLKKAAKRAAYEWKYAAAFVSRYYWAITNPVEEGKIFFVTFQGNYTCNPKYICEWLIRQGYTGKMVWVTDDRTDEAVKSFPKEVKVVRRNSREYQKELYSAQVWIDNAFNITRVPIIKKKKQIYIETMHGAMGIKKIGPEDIKNGKRNKRGFRCGKYTDYIISNSLFEEEVYKNSFWKDSQILPYGHPRNDMLVTLSSVKKDEIVRKVKRQLHLSEDSKIVLYAPTFRNYEWTGQKLDLQELRKNLERLWGGKWNIVVRQHPSEMRENICLGEGIVNGNSYKDIQELMLAVDVGITDYSSWIYDYVLLRRPGFIYAPDEDLYDVERGFYYPLEETPFGIAHDSQEMIELVRNFDMEQYQNRVEKFLKDRGCYEQGDACSKVESAVMDALKERNERRC